MATFYLDFEGGNDSNDGTTFANRWKTITNGATAARTAPGDTIRIMKSPDPVSLGVNGTFTKGSPTITLASGVTTNISTCQTSWTASANVTATTSTTRKEGTLAALITPAAAFTTGLLAYESIGAAINLSPYTKVSFWIMSQNLSLSANALRLDLCSDTTGTTPVASFTISQILGSSVWAPITLDFGGNLPSSIQSVALTALTDFGSTGIRLDNIIATNDLHFNSLIGTSSSATNMIWYPIRSINGTTVVIESEQNNVQGTATSRGWHDTTTTTTAYTRSAIKLSAGQTMQESGTTANRITYSGGWDRTNMNTQNGVTFVAGDRTINSGTVFSTNGLNFFDIRRLAVLWGAAPFTSTGSYNRFYDCGHYGCSTSFSTSQDSYIENYTAISNQTTGIAPTRSKIVSSIAHSNTGFGINATSSIVNDCSTFNNSNEGFAATGCIIQDFISRDNGTYGVNVSQGINEINGLITSGNATGAIVNYGFLRLNNATISETNTITSASIMTTANASRYSTYRGFQRANSAITVSDVNTPVHGAATRSYAHAPTAATTTELCIVQPLQPFAVAASTLVTFKIWVQRTSTNVEGRVRLKGYVTPGVDADVTATITAAINTWEELSVTCTPSAAGVVQIDLESYSVNGSTGTVYFGDATVTQA